MNFVNTIVDFVSVNKPLFFILPAWALTLFTVTTRSPIHSILSLICTFILTAVVFIIYFNLAFVGILLLVIYVGAIAILFLFVVMIIPMREKDLLPATTTPWVVNASLFVGLILFGMYGVTKIGAIDWSELLNISVNLDPTISQSWEALSSKDLVISGQLLYKQYSLHLVMCILLLFFALAVAIILCEDRVKLANK